MASLKNRRGVWYARVLWYEKQKKKEKQIALKTKSKVEARERLAEVNKVENDIKEGISFKFPWLSDSTRTKVKRFTLRIAVDKWIDKRMKHLAVKTIDSNQLSMDYFMKFLGGSIPLSIMFWIAVFIQLFNKPSKRLKYLSDSSYWIYIVHTIFLSFIPSLFYHIEMNVFLKFFINAFIVTLLCFLSYHYLVRKTFIGKLLNGKKYD